MQCEWFFEQLWRDYTRLTPQAARIQLLFSASGDRIVNDHVAFRTFNLTPISIDCLEQRFYELGYKRFEPYRFSEKKLNAWSYRHTDELQPRIFFSELQVEALSKPVQAIIHKLVAQVPPASAKQSSIFWRGRLWGMPSWGEYQQLLHESEYAAWLSVVGLRTNHFTLSVNALREPTLRSVIDKVQRAGFHFNAVGGIIKGSPEALLEQAATLADSMDITFADKDVHTITTCYYEFAKRYANDSGELYQGFVPANANAIFHSTDSRS